MDHNVGLLSLFFEFGANSARISSSFLGRGLMGGVTADFGLIELDVLLAFSFLFMNSSPFGN